MNEKAENLLNELVSKIGTKEEFEQVQKQLFKRGIEAIATERLHLLTCSSSYSLHLN